MGTDFTFSLPDSPTLLSAEGDFLIIAGSISQDVQHIYSSNTGREKEDRREEERERLSGEGNQEKRASKEENHTFFCCLMPQNKIK